MRAVRSAPPGVSLVEIAEPDGGEVVSIGSAGICASDFADIGYGSTMVLGHELAGVTEDGTAVAIEAIFGCDDGCQYCDAGQYNVCVHGPTALGVTSNGGMSEYFAAPARALVPLPAGIDVADACLVEPAAVATHACRLSGVGPEQRVAVVGGCRHDGRRDFDAAAEMLAANPDLVDALVTHRFPIDDAVEAFRVAADKSSGALRVVVEP